jgi:hypothetical protein
VDHNELQRCIRTLGAAGPAKFVRSRAPSTAGPFARRGCVGHPNAGTACTLLSIVSTLPSEAANENSIKTSRDMCLDGY